jgi:hypothetical protein
VLVDVTYTETSRGVPIDTSPQFDSELQPATTITQALDETSDMSSVAQSPRSLVGTTEDLIDQILFWIYAECSRGGCHLDDEAAVGCEHMHNLANLLTISKLWFEIAVKTLWGKYVTWDALQGLVCGPNYTPVSSTFLDIVVT